MFLYERSAGQDSYAPRMIEGSVSMILSLRQRALPFSCTNSPETVSFLAYGLSLKLGRSPPLKSAEGAQGAGIT